MAYNEFAYFYDEFNGEADYDALYAHIHAKLKEHGIHDGILADLGCGTGELTLMLTQAGYDMIGIDQSEEMLCVVRDKAEQLGLSGRLLLLRQDLLKLDLYGTIRGAVSTFDTFNHIPDLDTAIANAGFFMEKGGVFLFDMNTPYKHRNVLGDNAFTFEEEDAACVWRNHYDAANRRVEITVDIDYHETGEHFHEQFCEYTYDLDTIRTALEKHGFALESVCDGETFGPLTEDSQRYFFCAVKQYTQLEGELYGKSDPRPVGERRGRVLRRGLHPDRPQGRKAAHHQRHLQRGTGPSAHRRGPDGLHAQGRP